MGIGRVWGKDYDSNGWKTTDVYREEAVKYLTDAYPFLAVQGIKPFLTGNKCRGHYTAFVAEVTKAMGYGSVQLAKGGGKIGDDVRLKLSDIGLTVVKNRRTRRIKVHGEWEPRDLVLREEIDYVAGKQQGDMEAKDVELARAIARGEAEECGGTVECGCCCDDVAFEEMCQCDEGHLFCLDCLRRYAEEQLFGQQKSKLECMSLGEDGKKCKGCFSQDMIKRALPKKVLEKLEEAAFLSAVESAGLEVRGERSEAMT